MKLPLRVLAGVVLGVLALADVALNVLPIPVDEFGAQSYTLPTIKEPFGKPPPPLFPTGNGDPLLSGAQCSQGGQQNSSEVGFPFTPRFDFTIGLDGCSYYSAPDDVAVWLNWVIVAMLALLSFVLLAGSPRKFGLFLWNTAKRYRNLYAYFGLTVAFTLLAEYDLDRAGNYFVPGVYYSLPGLTILFGVLGVIFSAKRRWLSMIVIAFGLFGLGLSLYSDFSAR